MISHKEFVQPEPLAPTNDSNNPELPMLQDEAKNNDNVRVKDPTTTLELLLLENDTPAVLPVEDAAPEVEPTEPKIEQPTDATVTPEPSPGAVSYTHLTLPTILLV